MIVEDNLIRDITASVNKYFESKKDDVRLYLEGQPIDMGNLAEWAELRMAGPRIIKHSGSREFLLDVNIMVAAKPTTNIYRSQEIINKFAKSMEMIPVTDIDDESIGCFVLRNDVEHQLDIVPWGRVEVAAQLSAIQTSIEAFYRMEL